MTEREMYRISRKQRAPRQPWTAYGGKYTLEEANKLKKELENKGWEVSVYRAP